MAECPVSPADVDNLYLSGSDSECGGLRAAEVAFDYLEEISEEASPVLKPNARQNLAQEQK